MYTMNSLFRQNTPAQEDFLDEILPSGNAPRSASFRLRRILPAAGQFGIFYPLGRVLTPGTPKNGNAPRVSPKRVSISHILIDLYGHASRCSPFPEPASGCGPDVNNYFSRPATPATTVQRPSVIPSASLNAPVFCTAAVLVKSVVLVVCHTPFS